MSGKTDENLVQATLKGSSHAFDGLMARYQRLVYRIAFQFSREKQQALDLTQDIFLAAYQQLESLGDAKRFKAWIIRIAYNRSLSWCRQNRHHEPLEDIQLPDTQGKPERELLHQGKREILAAMLGKINPKYRLAIVLKYFEGLPIREIAGVLQCSEDVVRNMVYRGIKTMARYQDR